MPPVDAKPTGRVSFDSRGQAIWEWEIAPGVFSRDPDADRLAALDADNPLSLEDPDDPASPQSVPRRIGGVGDPRNQIGAEPPEGETPRKSLDDLRRLSEEIKRARHWPTAPKRKGSAER